jgi:hypothetical protein
VVILRRALALLLAGLVLVEGGGAARAIAAAGEVRCCCGAHSFARPCRCRACPAARRRAPSTPAHPAAYAAHGQHDDEVPAAAPALAPDGACHVASDGDALVPLALFSPPPALALALAIEDALPRPSSAALERDADPLRPPP